MVATTVSAGSINLYYFGMKNCCFDFIARHFSCCLKTGGKMFFAPIGWVFKATENY